MELEIKNRKNRIRNIVLGSNVRYREVWDGTQLSLL